MKAIQATILTHYINEEKERINLINKRIQSGCYNPIFKLIKLQAFKGKSDLEITSTFTSFWNINTEFLTSDLVHLGYTTLKGTLEFEIKKYTIYWDKTIKDV